MHRLTRHQEGDLAAPSAAVQAQVDEALTAHFAALEQKIDLLLWRERYLEQGLVKVREICPPGIWQQLTAEVHTLLQQYGVRRDVRIATTGDSPRRLQSVHRSYIHQSGTIIPALYYSSPLRDFLGRITEEPILICPYEDEQFVISLLSQPGDTHGWHWDDYSFGLVWIVESPPPDLGGFLQCVTGTAWDKSDPKFWRAFIDKPIRSYAFSPGDLYFIRSDTTLHRVYPLQGHARRIILNMAWARAGDLRRAITHETTDVVYTSLQI